ncbi:MAG: hypothetical protein RL277_1927 [Planctomycetota bacterium]
MLIALVTTKPGAVPKLPVAPTASENSPPEAVKVASDAAALEYFEQAARSTFTLPEADLAALGHGARPRAGLQAGRVECLGQREQGLPDTRTEVGPEDLGSVTLVGVTQEDLDTAVAGTVVSGVVGRQRFS